MKKNIVIALVLFFCMYGKAQNPIKWGVMGGLNYTNISNNENGNWKFGYKAGLISDIPISDKFSFQPSLLFSSKGSKEKREVSFTDIEGTYLGNVTLKMNANYIELPLLFALKMPVSNSTFSIYAGPYIAYGVAGKTTITSDNTNIFSWNTFEGEGNVALFKLNRFDWGFSAGIAEEIGRFKIFLNYDQGCQNVFSSSNNLFTDNKCYNYGLTLGLGVYF